MAASTGETLSDSATPEGARGSLRILLSYARPHRGILIAILLLTLVASAAGLAQPLVTETVLSSLAAGDSVLVPALLLGGLVLFAAGLTALNSWLSGRTAQRVVLSVRRGLIWRLIRLRVPELDRSAPGDLVARVTSDSTLLQNAATTGFIQVIDGVLTFVGAMVVMAVLSVQLLVATLVVLALVGLMMLFVVPRIRKSIEQAQESIGAVGAALDRSLGAARTVKANGAEQRETEYADVAVNQAYQAGLRGARYQAAVAVLMEIAFQVSFLAVLGFGGVLAASGSMSAATLIAFLMALSYLLAPISNLISGVVTLQQGLGAVGRIDEVEHMEVESDVDLVPAVPAGPPPRIRLDQVSFTYPDRPPALSSVSFTAPASGQTAIVGPSGAGKTTIFAMLQRFYEPSSGRVLLDDVDISTLTRAEVRRRIAYVEQEAPMLAGTIRENLVYSAPDAAEEDIQAVIWEAKLTTLIERLPDGLDTKVGTRGVALSGGERQRLAIARALLRKPQVLLLDEATAQLDARNEAALRETVARAAERCTVMLIAHRLSTVTAADQIVVLEYGNIRAVGTHSELVENDDLYRELATTQLLTAATPDTDPAPEIPAAPTPANPVS